MEVPQAVGVTWNKLVCCKTSYGTQYNVLVNILENDLEAKVNLYIRLFDIYLLSKSGIESGTTPLCSSTYAYP